ncbi:hypothetical protein [Marinoscillum sp.]|uniref:hypothetical protein n=1 Tax=Marinoscillum sp. TaxID=2024838 RepID=UPI003BAB2307
MKLTITLITVIILIVSCSRPEGVREPHRQGLTERGKKANHDKAVTYSLITVEIGTPKNQVNVAEEHLYGKFFGDRAEFYIVENPELYVSNAQVNRLTLYFIDGMLCKKKYDLESDISQELMKSYGSFKFKALNDSTRHISKSEKIVLKTNGRARINEHLNRFQMKWDKEEVLIRYLIFKDSAQAEIQLVEELSAYKYLLDQAEANI